jgi:thimet oligopeptidase
VNTTPALAFAKAGVVLEYGCMKIKTLTPKDFSWTKWSEKDFKDFPQKAIEEIKKDYAEIKKIPSKERNFENTLMALERAGKNYGQLLTYVDFLAEVSPEKSVREAASKVGEEYSKLVVDIIYDEEVYRALKEYEAKREKLAPDAKKLLKDTMRGYKRMGFDLPKEKRNLLKKNLKELSRLAISFRKNINDYKDSITLTKKEAYGLPERYLEGLSKDKNGNFIVTLEYPDIGPFLENSPNDKKRKEITDKNLKKGGKKNIQILTKIINLRHENAKLLGYKSLAHYVIEERMAKTPEKVMQFLNDLYNKVRNGAKKEREEVANQKREILGDKKAKYDYFDGYYVNQLKKKKYSVDNDKVREYFPFEKVKEGLFEIYQMLLNVSFEKVKGYQLWHRDVELYSVKDKGEIIAYFAMDLFPREGKYGHAAMFPLIGGREEEWNGEVVYVAPFATLVCNFPKPQKSHPSLLSHGEVETLFHEFGHVMHGILTKARFESQSGTNVTWDFVEMPSQMLESWVWDKAMLKKLSGHFKTGEKLPDDLIDRMINAKRFMNFSHYLRQMILALYDMKLHMQVPKQDISSIYSKMTKKGVDIALPKDQLFPAGFGHIGAGYAAGYYSYAWAESLAHDMFSRFEKEGLLNKKTGLDYRKWILEKGSSMEEMDLLKGFLGRLPNNKAFLKEVIGK